MHLHLAKNLGVRLVDGTYEAALPDEGQYILVVEDGVLSLVDHEGEITPVGAGLSNYRLLYTLTDDTEITNATAPLHGTGMGTLQLPPLFSSDVIVVKFAGRIVTDDTGTPTYGFRVNFDATEVANFGDFVRAPEEDVAVWGEARITVRNIGGSGVTSAVTNVLDSIVIGDPVSIDLTDPPLIEVLLEMTDSSAGDSFTCTALTIELLRTA